MTRVLFKLIESSKMVHNLGIYVVFQVSHSCLCSIQIGYNRYSVGNSVVQLSRFDCLFKLSLDLQYLFVYRPSTALTLPLSELESIYAECFGYTLSCAVYGSPTVELLFDHQQVKNLVKVRIRNCRNKSCSYIAI